MIEAYGTNITAVQNMNVPFANKMAQTNYAVVKDSDNETFELLMPGVYNVSFHGVATTTAAGDVSFQLLADGNVLPQTVVSATTGAGDIATVSFETNVRVAVAPMIQKAKLVVQYTGSAGTIDMADVIIKKVR